MNSKEIINVLTTDYIYLPYNKNMELQAKELDYIYKDELLLNSEDKKIYSSVSGKLLGLTTLNNKKYLVIENDFKEKQKVKRGTKKFINRYSKEEFINLLSEYKIIDNFDFTSKVLIINGLDGFNEEITFNTLIKNYTIEILDTIDALNEIMNIRKCFFAVGNNDSDMINILLNNIGTYPKIDLKMFTNNSIISKKEVLIDKLTSFRNKKYNLQYLSILDILKLYNLLKKNKPTNYHYLTIYDKENELKKVVRTNIGTNLNDVLNELKVNSRNVVINGLLSGERLKNTNFIIDENIRSVFIVKLNEETEKKCINCGLCFSICPININPKYMYFNNDSKAKLYKDKCINCGLCSYNCPSKINLNKGCNNDKK